MLKSIKSEVMADFICFDHIGITIITSKVTTLFNSQTVEKYIKEMYQIDSEKVKAPRLS